MSTIKAMPYFSADTRKTRLPESSVAAIVQCIFSITMSALGWTLCMTKEGLKFRATRIISTVYRSLFLPACSSLEPPLYSLYLHRYFMIRTTNMCVCRSAGNFKILMWTVYKPRRSFSSMHLHLLRGRPVAAYFM